MPKRLPSRPWAIAHRINAPQHFFEDEDDDEYENDEILG
jgi:hypothetical protein